MSSPVTLTYYTGQRRVSGPSAVLCSGNRSRFFPRPSVTLLTQSTAVLLTRVCKEPSPRGVQSASAPPPLGGWGHVAMRVSAFHSPPKFCSDLCPTSAAGTPRPPPNGSSHSPSCLRTILQLAAGVTFVKGVSSYWNLAYHPPDFPLYSDEIQTF